MAKPAAKVVTTARSWHVTIASGKVYGVAAASADDARGIIARDGHKVTSVEPALVVPR